MNTEHLRYILMVDTLKSINQAAKALYISQSSLSRILQNTENAIGLTLFERTKKGVITTYEGKIFIERIRRLLEELDQVEKDYFSFSESNEEKEVTLTIGAHHSSPVVDAFIQFFQKECQHFPKINLVLQEGTGEELFRNVVNDTLQLGILHYISSKEDAFLGKCNEANLQCRYLMNSPACVQIRSSHPLASKKEVTIEMLASYCHITFSDEDLTGINYCSNISGGDWKKQKKRIVVNERGTLRDLLLRTDGYYIGNNNKCNLTDIQNTVSIPISNYPYTIKTVCIYSKERTLTKEENTFLEYLKSYFEE